MAHNFFTRHPKEVGEGYLEHMGHAGGFGLKLVAAGLACIIHAIFPFLFVETGSKAIRGLHGTLTKRADKPNWERHPII
jgi:hypothetical protein